MTKALRDAFNESEKLPEAEQEQLAAAIRAELDAETAWEGRLTASTDALRTLADEALAEHRAGRTRPLDPTKVCSPTTDWSWPDRGPSHDRLVGFPPALPGPSDVYPLSGGIE